MPLPLPLPVGLSPSRVESFTSCPLAFRYAAIDHLPEPPAPWSTKGTLVHRALELLFCLPEGERTPEAAQRCLAQTFDEFATDPELVDLELDEQGLLELRADAAGLVDQYFMLEDPNSIRPIGLELRLEADVGSLRLRGIIDRLELDENGELVVTDYKTGKVPSIGYEQARLNGVHFYAYLCEQVFGRRPARVQLLYLAGPVAIQTMPTEQSLRFLPKRVGAVWLAIERACASDDFRPRPSKLCNVCAFRERCPAHADPSAVLTPQPLEAAPPVEAVTSGSSLEVQGVLPALAAQ